jgi:hypothetical protein
MSLNLMIKRTSDGLRDLLIRHGVTPTMDSKKDVELARKFMPKSYDSNWSDMLNKNNVRYFAHINETEE